MSNPAHALADLLERWEIPPRKTVVQARGDNPDELAFWREQGEAAMLLRELDNAIQSLQAMGKNVSHLWGDLVPLYKSVFGFSPPWQRSTTTARSNQAQPAVKAHYVKHLRTIGMMLEEASWVQAVDEASIAKVTGALDEAWSALEQLKGDIEERDRYHLFGLIAEARYFSERVRSFGAGRVRSSAMTVVEELKRQSGKAEQHQDSKTAAWLCAVTANLAAALFMAFGGAVYEHALNGPQDEAPREIGSTEDRTEEGIVEAEVVEVDHGEDEGNESP